MLALSEARHSLRAFNASKLGLNGAQVRHCSLEAVQDTEASWKHYQILVNNVIIIHYLIN